MGLLARLLSLVWARRVVVQGWSMAPALLPGERVLVDPRAYRGAGPRRGDIVLARHPHSRRPLLKRVVALPGETVRLTPEGLLVEGALAVPAPPPPSGGPAGAEWVLGPEEYFLVGDGLLSTDSREWGPVPRGDILGRAWLVYWPPRHRRRLD